MALETVTVDQRIATTADRVWERISTPEGIAKWWAPGDIQPVLGHEFTLDMNKWGRQPCKVIEVVPLRRLAYTFGNWELHWTITQDEGGCVLRLEHKGFDLSKDQDRFAFENMGNGWKSFVLPRLASSLVAAA
jgi:uncharacterized protein YndB with AHSA1/START domain